jgi:hypothetical protein
MEKQEARLDVKLQRVAALPLVRCGFPVAETAWEATGDGKLLFFCLVLEGDSAFSRELCSF